MNIAKIKEGVFKVGFPEKVKEIKNLKGEIDNLNNEIDNHWKKENADAQDALTKLQKDASGIQSRLLAYEKAENDEKNRITLEKTLNSKYPTVETRQYNARSLYGTPYSVDVRTFCANHLCNEFVQIANECSGRDEEETAVNCLKWVINHIRYVEDKKTSGIAEFWYFPHETLQLRKGDCEDGAFLLYAIMRASGIPYYKIRLRAGDVFSNDGSPLGGHCNVQYFYEKGGYWVSLDWCFFQSTVPVEKRKDYKSDKLYGNEKLNTWFSWNEKLIFATRG